MKRDEYIPLLKKALVNHLVSSLEGEEDEAARLIRNDIDQVNSSTTIGELFLCMSDQAFDIEGAIALAMGLLIEDVVPGEFADCPIGGWDT